MPKPYPPEFRRRVLDLVTAGRSVASVADDLGVSAQTIYNWRRQDAIDRGESPGLTSLGQAELKAARRRIVESENELAVTRRANELLKAQVVSPKGRFETIAVIASEGLPVQTAARVFDVSESGFYAWRTRPPSARSIRHAWLTDLIRRAHTASRGTYGAPRVHAELTMGYGIKVGHNAVEMLMRRAGLQGLPGSRRPHRRVVPEYTGADLVDRRFARNEPDQLWVTDITEPRTREGTVYCSVVLDVFSRRVVGWSIDSSPTSNLVTSALGMAIDSRRPEGTVIHSDRGTQGGFNWWSQHLESEELGWERGNVGRLIERCGLRCVRLVVRRDGGGSIGDGFGRESLGGCRAGKPAWPPVCLLLSEHVGFGRVAGCHRSRLPRCRCVTCRFPNGKRSPFFMPATVGCVRSPVGLVVHRRRSQGSCVVTPQPLAETWSIGPRPLSGTPTRERGVRRWPSSPLTTRCATTSRIGSEP